MQYAQESEQAFENLQWSFLRPSSTRYRLVSLEHFLAARRLAEASRASVVEYEPYLLEWAGEIAHLAETLEPAGLDADSIEHVADLLERSRRASPLIGADAQLKSAVVHLREKARAHGRLVGVARDRSRALIAGTGLYVPVAEVAPGGTPVHFVPGMRSVRFELQDIREDRDEITFEPASSDPSTRGSCVVQDALLASGRQLKRWQPRVFGARVRGKFRYTEADVVHDGSSNGLALAVSYACTMARALDCSVYHKPIPHLAVTGDLAADGAVIAVDPSRLHTEISATFHSAADSLVVPSAQLDLAERQTELLHRRFPNRTLHLVGISSLEDFFRDDRVVLTEHPTVWSRAFRSVWRRSYPVA